MARATRTADQPLTIRGEPVGVPADPDGRKYVIDRELEKTHFESLCQRALAIQTVRYAVAPGQAITTARRGIISAYGEVFLSDLENPDISPEDSMQRLIALGLVLEKGAA